MNYPYANYSQKPTIILIVLYITITIRGNNYYIMNDEGISSINGVLELIAAKLTHCTRVTLRYNHPPQWGSKGTLGSTNTQQRSPTHGEHCAPQTIQHVQHYLIVGNQIGIAKTTHKCSCPDAMRLAQTRK